MAGQKFRHPKPGKTIKVIGAGLPRTGTTSFCAALEILLDGPCYHAGMQYAAPEVPDERHAKTMIRVGELYPYNDNATRTAVETELKDLLDGYVAVADPPLSGLGPELLRLYPDAKVIVTVRDRDAWTKSMVAVCEAAKPTVAGYLLFWMPSVRWMPRISDGCSNVWRHTLGVVMSAEAQSCITIWERHNEHLKQLVPEDKLVFFDVKDGWEPLCKVLDVPIPDVPFPRLNDSKEVGDIYKGLIERGMARWGLFGTLLIAAIAGALLVAKQTLSSPPASLVGSSGLLSGAFGGSLAVAAMLMRYI